MTKAVGRALAASVLGALLGAAFMAFWFVINPRLDITFDTDPPRLVGGTYPAERDPATGLTFAWSGREVGLRIPGLDRSVDWILELRVRGARPTEAENPTLAFSVDDVPVATHVSHTDFETIQVVVPASPARRRGAVVAMQSSATFVPGASDPRALGVMIDRMSLSPAGVALPPRHAFAGASLSAAVLGAAVALLGVTTGAAVGAAVLLSAAAAAMLSRGFGPYTDYPVMAVRLAAWIGVCLTLLAAAVEGRQRQPLRNTARFVAAFSAGSLFLKLLVLLHPDMPVGDAMFHAHRFQGVLAGNLYFTSTAPGNYLFPYAPGFYVFAAPFARLVARGADDMTLLRIVAVSADTAAAVLLYAVIVRRWGDRIAAAMAVAFYHLMPLDFRIMTVGNLTNAFAQSLSVVVLAMLGAAWVRWERPAAVLLLTAALAVAFMSHTSTFAILFVAAMAIAVLFVVKGGPALRSPALAVAAAAAAACLLSIALYYGHFLETYRSEFARIGAETASAAADAGGRGIGARLATVPRYLHEYLGAPALMLAAAGGWHLRKRHVADRLTLSIAGWAVACALFLLIGVLTPVDMRYYLASIPAVAISAAVGASALWSGGRDPRLAAGLLLAWVVWTGIRTWWTTVP
jgi:hypothetical protein